MSEMAERDRVIVGRHLEGESFAEIARDYGLTLERVRQIVRAAGISPEESRRRTGRGLLAEWTCQGCGKVEMRRPTRQRHDYCSKPCASANGDHGQDPIPDDELLVALQDLAVRLGHTPGIHQINADPDTPSHTTYVRAFGSVAEAQEAAGLNPNSRGGGPGYRGEPLPDWIVAA